MIIQRVIEIIRSFPELPLWMALSAVLPVTWSPLLVYFGITGILALLDWTGLARAVRSKLLALREEDYCTAARLMGASPKRIIGRHLLPGFMSHLIAAASLSIPSMILGETALSFLGIGLRPPITSWGVLLNEAQNINVVALYPWLMLPVLPVIVVILAFNFFGDGLARRRRSVPLEPIRDWLRYALAGRQRAVASRARRIGCRQLGANASPSRRECACSDASCRLSLFHAASSLPMRSSARRLRS